MFLDQKIYCLWLPALERVTVLFEKELTKSKFHFSFIVVFGLSIMTVDILKNSAASND